MTVSCFRFALMLSVLSAMPAIAQSPDSLVSRAALHLAAGDSAAAVAAYRRAIDVDPTHGAAGLLISLLDVRGQTAEAVALGESYYRHGPRNPRALFRYGWVLLSLWEQARADSLYRDLVRLDSAGIYSAWGHGELAYLARARGEADAAIQHMRTAVDNQPSDAISAVGLAQMLLNAGRANEALPILQRALARDTLARGYGQQPAQVLLAWALFQVGDSTAAHDVLTRFEPRVLRMSPTRRMQFYAVAGRIGEALAVAEQTRTIGLYGGPDPRDGMLAPLRGHPRYEALLARSRARVNATRAALGLRPILYPND